MNGLITRLLQTGHSQYEANAIYAAFISIGEIELLDLYINKLEKGVQNEREK